MSPVWYLVLPTLTAIDIAIGITAISLPDAMRHTVIEATHRSSVEMANQFKSTREDEVRYFGVLQKRHADASSNTKLDTKTQFRFHSEKSEGATPKEVSIISTTPYRTFKIIKKPMDDFQTNAWVSFQQNPNAVFEKLETMNGQRSLRVVVPDHMTDSICVSCHNSSTQSGKQDWKIGDVSAVLEVTTRVEPYLAAAEQRSNIIVGSLAVGGCSVTLVLIAFTGLIVRRTQEKQDADRASNIKITHLARHDSLTGLINRAVFMEKIEEACAGLRLRDEAFNVLMLDLDRFKAVNDLLGHPAGDALLQEVTQRLRSALREADVLARLGGDEFAIIIKSETDQREFATELANRIIGAIAKPFGIDGNQLNVGVSVGIAAAPGDGADPVDLVKKADIALYQAKVGGRSRYCFFDAGMLSDLDARNRLERDLRAAISSKALELHYQPVVDAKTGMPCGVEALARWHHPELGMVAADKFIPLAEQTGLIMPLGELILRKACADAAGWPEHIKVAVNLSPMQFKQTNLLDVVMCVLAESGLPPQRLELEVTETVFLANDPEHWAVLGQLKALGISIALDDFGTGYSSLSHLTMFPFDKIKIDKSFTQGMTKSASCAAVISSTLAIGRGLDMTTTAEGVETMEQFELLRASGVTFVQGYLFGEPGPASNLEFSRVSGNAQINNAA